MMVWVFVIIGLVLLGLGVLLLYTTHYWFLGLTVCGPADKLMTFTDPNRVIKEYYCHDV